MGRRGRDGVSQTHTPKNKKQKQQQQKPLTPGVETPSWEGSQKYETFFPEEWGVCAVHQTPQLLDPPQERCVLKMPGFENQRGLHLEES